MQDLLNGRKEINKSLAREILIVFGVNESWVFDGQYPMFDDGCKVQYRSKLLSAATPATPLEEIFPPSVSEKQLKIDI